MTETPGLPQSRIVTDVLAEQIVQETTAHINLSQDTIIITEDKMRLCLMTHLQKAERRYAWLGPAGILATLLATFATTTFHDYYLPAAVWSAIFIVAAILTAGWLIKSLWQARGAATVDDLVSQMKTARPRRSPDQEATGRESHGA